LPEVGLPVIVPPAIAHTNAGSCEGAYPITGKEMTKMANKGTSKMEKTKDSLKNFKPNRNKTAEDKMIDGPNAPAE
jgi:hypothetical protein